MTRQPVELLVSMACVAAVMFACDRVSERTHSDEPGENAVRTDAPSPVAGEEGADCSVDGDCKGYLRCIDNTCRVPPAVTGRVDEDTPQVVVLDEDGAMVAEFHVELAQTDAEQRRGLMFRREMQPDWGMLFVYDDEARRSFWMENTFIALDMVFIDASGEVDSIVEGAEPLTRVKRNSRGAARYVLELNAGTAEDVGIEPGMTVRIDNVDDAVSPQTSGDDTQ